MHRFTLKTWWDLSPKKKRRTKQVYNHMHRFSLKTWWAFEQKEKKNPNKSRIIPTPKSHILMVTCFKSNHI